jgi:hypothetical protein
LTSLAVVPEESLELSRALALDLLLALPLELLAAQAEPVALESVHSEPAELHFVDLDS